MEQGKIYTFHDFTLDLGNASLRQGQTQHRLRPKAFAMLRYFVERPAQLISKDELFRALWPNIVVDDATLTGCVRELRAVLNDNAKHPRFIETVPTRGYRWVAASATLVPGSRFQVSSSREEESLVLHGTWNGKRETVLVGRDTELTQLHRWLDSARSGERQVVFVTGEPGIGKTSLIDVFLSEVRGLRSETYTSAKSTVQGSDGGPDPSRQPLVPVFIGRGQCVKQYGANEAYLPVFEAMEHLAKGEHREHVLAVLHQYAPTWLVQMPGLLSPEDVRLLQARIVGATRERMLREIAEAFEVLTREQVLILWFDDLHDSDPSTLDLLTYLARRQQPARLLLLGTYRPAEALTHPHGLPRVQQELRERRQWQEVTLTCLDEPTVAHYLTLRLTGKSTISLSALAHAIHCRTEGHPLFLVSLVEDLQAHHLLVQQQEQWKLQVSLQDVVSRIPATLYGTLSGQFHSLSPEEQTALEAASVAGLHFTVPVISAATGQSPLEAEEICESLVRRERFIFRDGVEEWPDATLATRYRFRHAFHQDVAYQRIPPLKRSHLHQKIGERKEQAFASEVGSTAVELAMHFEGSRDYGRAAHYLQQAGAQAVRRSAYNEALSLVTKGLAFLRQMPDSPQRPQLELGLHMVLASSLSVTKGASAVEVGQSYHRALELCRQERDDPQIFPALAGLFGFYLVRAEYQTAYELGGQLLHLAERQATPILRLMAHLALGVICLFRGELSQAAAHFGQRSALYDSRLCTSVMIRQ